MLAAGHYTAVPSRARRTKYTSAQQIRLGGMTHQSHDPIYWQWTSYDDYLQNHHHDYQRLLAIDNTPTMNSHRDASRITDVVPANFLCDNQAMQKITDSQVMDEKALLLLEENLSVLETRQRCLKDELAAVERLISEAVAEQTRLRSSIETHKSLLAYSPIRGLPGEVLSEIFLHCIAVSQPTRRTILHGIVASQRTRARIIQVCRRWRTTALADPRLWTAIPFIDDKDRSWVHSAMSGPQAADGMQARIDQTTALPLQLLFHFDQFERPDSIDNQDVTSSSLQTFIRLFPRANTIFFCFHHRGRLCPEIMSVMTGAALSRGDQVHTARIDVYDGEFRRKLLSAIPNVEVLEVESHQIDQWLIDIPTAGHRLRRLHLRGGDVSISLQKLLDLLDRAPLLETLKVARISTPRSVDTLRTVTHAVLSTFSISNIGREGNDAIFGHLTLPALRSLTFGGNYLISWPSENNLSFFERSGCMLTELAFYRCQVNEQRLKALFNAQNKITTLQLNCSADDEGVRSRISEQILPFLSAKAEGVSEGPLPALTVLRVSICPNPWDPKALKRLIQARRAKNSGFVKLRKVYIEVQMRNGENNAKKDELAALFEAFTKKGMMIQISYIYDEEFSYDTPFH